jgi:peptidoglycan hydrolase-like protein with peptidoglycan-binding domain
MYTITDTREFLDELGLEVPFAPAAGPSMETGAGYERLAQAGPSPFLAEDEGEAALEGFEPELEDADGVVFPSGLRLQRASGRTGRNEEHWDPHATGLPLLATPPSVHGNKVSPHFTVKELVSSGGRPASMARISPALVNVLEAIREHTGKPVRILSGYRSWLRNQQVYAARGQRATVSRHCSGQAADIAIAGMSGLQLAKIAIDAAGTELALGIGVKDLHVDVRGQWTLWSYLKNPAQRDAGLAEVRRHRDRVLKGGAPIPVPKPQPGPPSKPGSPGSGEMVVARHPLIRAHKGTEPDLMLLWNQIAAPGEVDVVVHFHGYSGSGVAMRIHTEKRPISGIEFSSDSGRNPRPIVALLPRGHFHGGKYGNAYLFPALTQPGALKALVADSLARVGERTGQALRMGRLIITGHSGGGAPIMQVLAHMDPDEIHIYDGTYNPVGNLVAWAKARIARESASPPARPAALRVLYKQGTGTEAFAKQISKGICEALADPAAAALRPLFKVEALPYKFDHNGVPGRFGGLLLFDPAAVLPIAKPLACAGGSSEAEAFSADEVESLDEAWSETESFEGEAFDAEAFEAEAAYLEADEAWNEEETEGEGEENEYLESFDEDGHEHEAMSEGEGFAVDPPAGEDESDDEDGELEHGEALAWLDSEQEEGEDEAAYEDESLDATGGLAGEVMTLQSLLESEAGAGSSLADRMKGVAEFVLGPNLKRGSRGGAVASLQRSLASLGYDIAVDGAFGPNTERSVRAFQAQSGLTADGIVGPRTKTAIAQALGNRPGPLPAPPQPAPPATSALGSEIARIAEQEFKRWRPQGVVLKEADDAAIAILQQYYREAVNKTVTAAQLKDPAFRKARPWSGLFISWVMRTAGAGSDFAYSELHQHYVAKAKRNRVNGTTANPFWAYRPTEVAPQVGDLICWDRANSGATYDNIDGGTKRLTHSDVVTQVMAGSVRTVGGNVNDTVGAKTVRTLADGRVALDGTQAKIYAILRCRGAINSQPPAPVPPGPKPSVPDQPQTRDTIWPLRVRPDALAAVQGVRFRNGAEIHDWFMARTGMSFIAWFNANHAKRGWWGPVPRRDSKTGAPLFVKGKPKLYRSIKIEGAPANVLQSRFVSFWNHIPVCFAPSKDIGLVHFLALMSIAINEVNGDLVSHSENGSLKYMFNYNRPSGNKLASELFSDPVFNAAHGMKALGSQLMGNKDPVWKGRDWPSALPEKPSPPGTTPGYLDEADFYKFRGRGVIQTTFRTAYKQLLLYITNKYTGANPTLLGYQAKWRGRDPDSVLTQSSNLDWDVIFAQQEIVPIAVHLHASSWKPNYLQLAADAGTLNSEGNGSIYMVGRRISGSVDYGRTFAQRVVQLFDGLANPAATPEAFEDFEAFDEEEAM